MSKSKFETVTYTVDSHLVKLTWNSESGYYIVVIEDYDANIVNSYSGRMSRPPNQEDLHKAYREYKKGIKN
jgi:hypothetical protein